MKRQVLFLIYLFFCFALEAKEVSKEQALLYAQNFFQQIDQPVSIANADILAVNASDNSPLYYIINFNPQGWILIAADDLSSPVLGYSPNNKFILNPENLALNDWLEGYKKQIKYLKKTPGLKRHPKWEAEDRTMLRASALIVQPLIKINWNQGSGYNQYCPADSKGPGGHALVGCVAVAMGQALSVAQAPTRPSGSYSYTSPTYGFLSVDYDKEVPYDWNAIIVGSNGKKELARLLYHCGVAVDMMYGPASSGTYNSKVAAAFRRNFSMDDNCKYYKRGSYSDTDWKKLILQELENGRPIIYGGDDGSYGHSFNLDGYDGNDWFHFNWGWGGVSNGYFPLSNLNDGSHNYKNNHDMIVGISGKTNMAPTNIILSTNSVKEHMPIGTEVADVTVVTNNPAPNFVFTLKGDNLFPEGNEDPAFVIDRNQKLRTKIIFDYKTRNEYVLYINVNDKSNKTSFEKKFVISVVPTSGVESIEGISNYEIFLVPGTQIIQIINNTDALNPVSYEILDISGSILGRGNLHEKINEISLPGDMNRRVCIVRCNDGQLVVIKKIIFQ